MLAVLFLTGASAGSLQGVAPACADLSGAPLASAPDLSTCEAYAGQCDASYLTTAEKATLLLHCPATCGGTKYGDGGGLAYCPYVAGHDSCFDEPPNCASQGSAVRPSSRALWLLMVPLTGSAQGLLCGDG